MLLGSSQSDFINDPDPTSPTQDAGMSTVFTGITDLASTIASQVTALNKSTTSSVPAPATSGAVGKKNWVVLGALAVGVYFLFIK